MNKPVYRFAEQLGEYFKVLATDQMVSVQLQPKMITITCTTDPVIVTNAFDDELTQECSEADFMAAYIKAADFLTKSEVTV